MTIDKDGLAPCPFCGSDALSGSTLDDQFYVMCGDDNCSGMAAYLPSEAEAIAAWNRRALPNTGDELVARLRQVPRHEGHSYPVEGAIRVVPYGNMLNDAADAIASLAARAHAAEASLASAREDALDDDAAAQWLRQWVRRKFGPWITWRTAWSAIKEMRAQPTALNKDVR